MTMTLGGTNPAVTFPDGTIQNSAFNGTSLSASPYTTSLGANTLVNNSGTANTAVGNGALQANTTASNNTAVGYQAGYSNTTGSPNTYIGYRAGWTGTTNNACTAVGYQALYSNTGNGNTAVGGSDNVTYGGPLQSNTTGVLNSAFGAGAMGGNTTGSYNTGLGMQALASNTTASNNTAVGYQAGYNNTTATGNAYFGNAAGYTNTVGASQTFLGAYSGNATTGSANTFIGAYAGYYVTSGVNNTIVGPYSGNQGGLDIRTANNYIVLSDGAGNPRGVFNGNGQYLVNATSPISSGQVGVIAGSSNNGLEVKVTNNGYAPFVGYNSSGSLIFYADGGGTIHAVSTSITAISDQKLKTNIKTIKYGLDTVNQLKPVTFDFIKNDLVNGETGKLGFIAQDVESVIPELVADGLNKSENGTPYKTLNMGDMLPVLVKAVQELNAKVTALEAQLGAK